ncbi:MAG: hypothetical protein ABSF48_09910 [Thermodesulfobacteriota bacterium]|jgi:hypothetical protein
MSIYEVCFIKQANDPAEKHLIIEVEASAPDEAEKKARQKMEAEKKWLVPYPICGREIKRF